MSVTLVLDTNILRQEGMSSRNMQMLFRLTESGEVDLFLPDIVCREFISQKTLEVQEQAHKCLTALGEIGKQVGSKSKIQNDLKDLRIKLNALVTSAAEEIEGGFKGWLLSSKAKLLEFKASDMVTVLDDYFAGSGVFRRPKHRDDIPDAIVGVTMRRLLEERDCVHVAIKDGAFKKHLQSETKYRIVDGLGEFFELEEIKAVLVKLDSDEKNAAAFKNLVSKADFQSTLTNYLRDAKELLEEVYVEKGQLGGVENLEINVWGASLNFAQANAITEITYYKATYIARGHLSIELAINTEARIDYAADYYEFNRLSRDRDVDNWSVGGDGACELREFRKVTLMGYVEVKFPGAWAPEALAIHSHYIGASTSQIKVELDIQEALIL